MRKWLRFKRYSTMSFLEIVPLFVLTLTKRTLEFTEFMGILSSELFI